MSAIGMSLDGHPAVVSSAVSAGLVLSPDADPKLVLYGPSELSKWRTEKIM